MKNFVLKIVNNPGVRKAFYALLLAVAAAAGFAQAGCAEFPQSKSAADAADLALCLAPLLVDVKPEELTYDQVQELKAQAEACLSAS